jgi:glycosyltransferase involved in cell wall biosynthesis
MAKKKLVNDEIPKRPMRVAVYSIALNEEKFVQRWHESSKAADYHLIADTGSTDGTLETASKLGINVIDVAVRPWRFDDARNASLVAIPDDVDYCIALDMDEVLLPGWREELEKAFEQGWTRPRYQYTWNWKDDAETLPSLQYGGDKIHARKGYRWTHPVHEVLKAYGDVKETQGWLGLEIHHHPDKTKSRSQYFPLLAMSVAEAPHDDRNAFYYARELYFYNRKEAATAEFKRHLALPSAVWAPERAASMRYLAKLETENAADWLNKAIEQAPGRREQLVELAMHHYGHGQWQECYEAAVAALAIKSKPLDYLCEDFAWGALPWDLGAIAAHNLGLNDVAIDYGTKAEELDPGNERLKKNNLYYRAAGSSSPQ